MYKNRPIYWLVSSGKERTFQCLFYMHRYTPSTLARIRTNYVHDLQSKLYMRSDELKLALEKETISTKERNTLKREDTSIKKQLAELRNFDQELHHLADQKISIDLDDGVKHNYGLFGNILAERKKVTGEKK